MGCVIGTADGVVLGVGSTQETGGPHAEIMALRAARAAGHDLRGATAWVTLEPCAHHGRTPPCCEALIAGGLARVVVAVKDPNPQVAGKGIDSMRAAGLVVEIAQGDWSDAARELNIGFFSRHERGRPWVRLKLATSLDGRTALNNGISQWITSAEARADGHAWRKRASVVMTGIGTVLADDPRLDLRNVNNVKQPLRVVVDSTLRLPASARILQPPGRVLVFTTCTDAEKHESLRVAGAEILNCGSPGEQVDLHALIEALGSREFSEIHVEAGSILSGALIRQQLVDEILLYVAPKVLGPGRDAVTWPPFVTLADAPLFRFTGTMRVGSDLRLTARRVEL